MSAEAPSPPDSLEAKSPFELRLNQSKDAPESFVKKSLDTGDVGFLHSFTTGSAVDGPGVRVVAWTAGCQWRCRYCHNPDTWFMTNGMAVPLERAVDDARPQVPHGLAVGVARREEEVHQVLARVEPSRDALHDRGEVRVAEEHRGVLGNDQRDRARGAARERACGAVGHVVQLRDRGVDRALDLGRHLRRAVDDAAHGRPRHVGLSRHHLEGRRRRSRPRARSPLHAAQSISVRHAAGFRERGRVGGPRGRQRPLATGRARSRMTRWYARPLSLIVRSWVS